MDTDNANKQNKIFISHASDDKEYVEKFVDLLDSIGVPEKSIVCTSVPGHLVPNGEDIYDWLRAQFTDYNIRVIYMLSKNYYESAVCLNEMGAAWVVRSEELLILLPGFSFESVIGCVDKNKAGIKLDGNEDELKDRLGQLKNSLVKEYGLDLSDTKWERRRNEFINSIKELEGSDITEALVAAAEDVKNDRPGADLSFDEQIFLVFTANSPSPDVRSINALGGKSISGGNYSYTQDRSARNIARWERVVKRLEEKGYIEDHGYKGELFDITDKGFEAADEIKASLNIDISKNPDFYLYPEEQGPMLSFNLENNPVGDDPGLRTKTSDSDYILEIANTGEKAAMLTDCIDISIKGYKEEGEDYLVCSVFLGEDERTIQPNQKIKIRLAQQDYSAMKHYCREMMDYKYDVSVSQIADLPNLHGTLDITILVGEDIGRFSGVDSIVE